MTSDATPYEDALNKGHSFSWDQRWDDAIESFKAAAAERPDAPAPYAGLGMAYFELGQLDKALANYMLAARYSEGDIIYLKQVADVQERLGRAREAAQTYMAIGEVQLRRRILDEAMANWLRAVHLEPNLLGAHQRLASVYQRQGQVEPAVRSYLAIARIFQAQGQTEKALETCQMALRLAPRNPEVLTALELLQQGESLTDDEPKPATGELDDIEAAAAAFDTDDLPWVDFSEEKEAASSPVQDAYRMAREQLAEEIFSDTAEDEAEELPAEGVLSKMQRDTLISQALDFQTRDMVNEAISCYEQAIAGGVTSPAAHFNLGLLYQSKMRFGDAIRQFSISVKEHEYRLASHYALGESYRARGHIDKAVEHFIKVLKIVDLATVSHDQADRLIELYENLADSLLSKGEQEQATAFANALVSFLGHKGWEDKVKDARARLDALSEGGRTMILGDMLTAGSEHVLESLFLSQEYVRRGMLNSAIEEIYRAIQLSPDYLPAHLQLAELLARQDQQSAATTKFVVIGDTYRVREDINGALVAYERAADISPFDLSIKGRLIELLKRNGLIDRALEHFLAMGEAYYQMAQADKARETYQEALRLTPRSSDSGRWRLRLLRLVADIDMQRFDWKSALAAYQELHQENPEDERTVMTLIDLYFKVGQPSNALRALDRYLIYLVKSRRAAKVEGILKDMVQQRPNVAALTDRLVRLYVQQKRSEDAIQALDKLGELQLEAGEKEKAVTTIEKLLSLNPPDATGYRQLLQELKSGN